jgi:predicted CXXCH cytochrome family protein
MSAKSRILMLMLTVAAVAFLGPPALAFHDGGVANCTGCHSMHSSLSSTNLLIKTDQSSTCLSCHESATGPSSYRVSTAASALVNSTDIPKHRSPGGDFGWLRQTFTATASFGSTVTNSGFQRGHNIQAADYGYTYVDGTTAPGGTMPAAQLSCISCHDPHGKARRVADGSIKTPTLGGTYEVTGGSGSYGAIPTAGEAVGVYRLLGGTSYQAFDGGPNFPGTPAAVVNSSYNRTEQATQTRVAYGHGTTQGYASWGKWCSTCHPEMHKDTASKLVHVVDDPLSGEATTYNAYVKTGDLTGNATNSFTSLVPFAKNTTDTATLAALAKIDDSDLSGPDATDRIACLSCHRAHAGGWHYNLRWNTDAEVLTFADATGNPIYPGIDAGLGNQGQYNRGYTIAQMAAAYYDRPATKFAAEQRSLCNKCHAKD